MPTDVRERWVFSPETTIFLSINQWNLLPVKIWLVNKQLPFIPSTNVLHYCISFFSWTKPCQPRNELSHSLLVIQQGQSVPATPVFLHRIQPQLCRSHRRNHLFMTQKRFPHSRQLVQDHRKAQRKQPSLSLLWISPSSDPPLPLQCCKTYTLLVSSPSPPLRIQM